MENKQDRCSCEKSWQMLDSELSLSRFRVSQENKTEAESCNFLTSGIVSVALSEHQLLYKYIICGSLRPVKGIHCMKGKRFSATNQNPFFFFTT